MLKHLFEDLDVKMENKGGEMIISVKGDKEKLASLEKKLKALKELHEGCNCHCC